MHRLAATAALIAASSAAGTAQAQSYYQASDGTVSFSKAPFADWTNPANWDQITPNVAVTRKNTEGIFNPLTEAGHSIFSPDGTEWVFNATVQDVINGTVTNADFVEWRTAHLNNPPATVGANAVMWLIAEDAYVDVVFTQWSVGTSGGGGFAYTRAVVPSADCPADVNNDGVASPADFTAWLACFNDPMSAPFCDRADVNGSGATDPADFTAWLAAFSKGCD